MNGEKGTGPSNPMDSLQPEGRGTTTAAHLFVCTSVMRRSSSRQEQIDILDSWRTGSLLPILLPTSRARNRGAAACCGAEGWVAAAVLRAGVD